MDAIKFIEERNRMCNSYSPDCEGCRVDEAKPVISECFRWILDNPEKAVQFVAEWSAAHPRKTRQDVFLEQWPNADTMEDGTLIFSPCSVDRSYRSSLCNNRKCRDCRREFWGEVVE